VAAADPKELWGVGMSQSFSTELIPAPDRQEAWLSNAKQICGECKFHFPKRSSFHGSIERRKVADLEMTLFSSSPISFTKYPLASLSSESRTCIVITQLAGLRRYCQEGKVAVLRKGDTTLIDSARPWFSDCPGDCARLYLRVPRLLLESRLRLGELPYARRISGETGLGAILFHLSTSLYNEAEDLTLDEGTAAIESYLRILAACVGKSKNMARGLSRLSELAARITHYIDVHLTETALSPAEIASAMDISVRHVHRVFSHQGLTVADWIRAERLRRCRDDLSDPRLQSKSITEIAFFWGFNDSAHFSRAFKKQYRICPRVFRSHVQVGLAFQMDGRKDRNRERATWFHRLRAS
jgi:AraC family transcriptional regulator, positive regulator of tynA and feaB